jgi:hypothetical protein
MSYSYEFERRKIELLVLPDGSLYRALLGMRFLPDDRSTASCITGIIISPFKFITTNEEVLIMSRETYYWTCPFCGANLDPGERCDCRDETPSEDYRTVQEGGEKEQCKKD